MAQPWWLQLSILTVMSVILFQYSRSLNYQNYSKLTYILIAAIILAFICVIVQCLICMVNLDFTDPIEAEKWRQIYRDFHDSVIKDEEWCRG